MKRKKQKKKVQKPKTPLTGKELLEKIKSIKAKLQDMKEYKAILTADGLKPDEEDKRRESDLIVQLLRLEKQAGIRKPSQPTWRGKKTGGKKTGGKKKAAPKTGRPDDKKKKFQKKRNP